MATVRSNLATVRRAILQLPHILDLTRVRDGKRLGDRLFDRIAEHIQQRSLAEQAAPDGTPWAPNAPAYAKRKGYLPIGVLKKQMLSITQLKGTRLITGKRGTMTYGVTPFEDQKAEWFQEGTKGRRRGRNRKRLAGGRGGQPPRPFYEMDDRTEADLDKMIAQEATDALLELF